MATLMTRPVTSGTGSTIMLASWPRGVMSLTATSNTMAISAEQHGQHDDGVPFSTQLRGLRRRQAGTVGQLQGVRHGDEQVLRA